ncbi:hypothetical protein ACQJBY_033158 [Aegilops geniculata]
MHRWSQFMATQDTDIFYLSPLTYHMRTDYTSPQTTSSSLCSSKNPRSILFSSHSGKSGAALHTLTSLSSAHLEFAKELSSGLALLQIRDRHISRTARAMEQDDDMQHAASTLPALTPLARPQHPGHLFRKFALLSLHSMNSNADLL